MELSDGLATLSAWLAVTDRLVGGGEALWMHGRVVIRYCMDGYNRRYGVFI